MGLESFGRFQQLRNRGRGYPPSRIGFSPKVNTGYINRLDARINVAKSFQGINLPGISEPTVTAYNAFFQVFLTHSALERFIKIIGIKKVSGLDDLITSHGSEKVVKEFFDLDGKGKLYDFLCEHLDEGGMIEKGFSMCKRGESTNVAYVSAAVRHIFAHGHLTANASDNY
ncbi:MAG: hypothetical protein M3R38_15550, partial [Actinomycetota bacterium]|nr:hypothetical protein [Actinomycetota bacterium]